LTDQSIGVSYTPAVSERAIERYRSGEGRDLDQRQLTQLANAAWAAGLLLLLESRQDESREWLRTAAARYRASWDAGAPADSWGRPVAAMKSLLLAGDDASDAARWAIDAGAADAESPIGRYAAGLAYLVLGDDVQARVVGSTLRDDASFPTAVADAVVTLAATDRAGYMLAVEDILESFELRTDFLEDVRVADTVLVFQALAARRDCDVELRPSPLLPNPALRS
jgi:hypothetical protein